jgi:hypothetical protein
MHKIMLRNTGYNTVPVLVLTVFRWDLNNTLFLHTSYAENAPTLLGGGGGGLSPSLS